MAVLHSATGLVKNCKWCSAMSAAIRITLYSRSVKVLLRVSTLFVGRHFILLLCATQYFGFIDLEYQLLTILLNVDEKKIEAENWPSIPELVTALGALAVTSEEDDVMDRNPVHCTLIVLLCRHRVDPVDEVRSPIMCLNFGSVPSEEVLDESRPAHLRPAQISPSEGWALSFGETLR